MAAKTLLEWANAPYHKNTNFPKFLKHRTSTGELVRSKSEALIYEKLKEYGIAFRYEAPLTIGNTVIYPDFTIMRQDNKIFYWEHAGLSTLKQYREDILWKINTYANMGIGQWDNLIIIYDTGDGKIDTFLNHLIHFLNFISSSKVITLKKRNYSGRGYYGSDQPALERTKSCF